MGGGGGGFLSNISYNGTCMCGSKEYSLVSVSNWLWISQKRVWIPETWSENGYKFQRPGLKKDTRKLHCLV